VANDINAVIYYLIGSSTITDPTVIISHEPEMRGSVSADRYFADVRNSHGYG